jgi:CheY-like chemotaxis protein
MPSHNVIPLARQRSHSPRRRGRDGRWIAQRTRPAKNVAFRLLHLQQCTSPDRCFTAARGVVMQGMTETLTIPHVLLVDERADDREASYRLLTRQGCRITQATDGFEALASVEGEVPDLVVTDLALTGMHGFELCEELHASPRTNHVPIILTTALASESPGINHLIEDFGATLVEKPYPPATLSTSVDALLRTSPSLRQLSEAARRRARVLQRRAASLPQAPTAVPQAAVERRPPGLWQALLARSVEYFDAFPEGGLTVEQAATAWAVSPNLAALSCECLRRRGFLVRTEDGFVRVLRVSQSSCDLVRRSIFSTSSSVSAR